MRPSEVLPTECSRKGGKTLYCIDAIEEFHAETEPETPGEQE